MSEKTLLEHLLVQATPDTNPGQIANSENCSFQQFAPLVFVCLFFGLFVCLFVWFFFFCSVFPPFPFWGLS